MPLPQLNSSSSPSSNSSNKNKTAVAAAAASDTHFTALFPPDPATVSHPHNPHPPPAACLPHATAHLRDALSAKRALPRPELLGCLESRLRELSADRAAHERRVAAVRGQIDAARRDAAPPTQPPPGDAAAAAAAAAHQLARRLEEKRQAIYRLQARHGALRRRAEEQRAQHDERLRAGAARAAALRAELVAQILAERERDLLRARTHGYPRVPAWRQRELGLLEATEGDLMAGHDDVNMTRIPLLGGADSGGGGGGGGGGGESRRLSETHAVLEATLLSEAAGQSVSRRRSISMRSSHLGASSVQHQQQQQQQHHPRGRVSVLFMDVVGVEKLFHASPSYAADLLAFVRRVLREAALRVDRRRGGGGGGGDGGAPCVYEWAHLGFRSAHVAATPLHAAAFAAEVTRVADEAWATSPLRRPLRALHQQQQQQQQQGSPGAAAGRRRSSGTLHLTPQQLDGDPVWLTYPPQVVAEAATAAAATPASASASASTAAAELPLGPLFVAAVDHGPTTCRLSCSTMCFVYRGRPVADAAAACGHCRPGETLLTAAAHHVLAQQAGGRGGGGAAAGGGGNDSALLQGLNIEEVAAGGTMFYSVVPAARGGGESGGGGRRLGAAAQRGRLACCGPHQTLPLWWEHPGTGGAACGHPCDSPLVPHYRLRARKVFKTAQLELLEYQLMRQNDEALKRVAPTGTVTLVFTDVQGSTNLWDKQTEAMKQSLTKHNALMRQSIERYQGYEVRTEGDAFMVAFEEAKLALAWCTSMQRQLMAVDWPPALKREADAAEVWDYNTTTQGYERLYHGLRVRMGFNLCEPSCQVDPTSGRMGYFGPSVHLASRIADTGKGGEITIGLEAYKVLERQECLSDDDIVVTPLGRKQLAGISKAESLFLILPKELQNRYALRRKREKEAAAAAAAAAPPAGGGAPAAVVPAPAAAGESAKSALNPWAVLQLVPKMLGRQALTERHVESLAKLDKQLPKLSRRLKAYYQVTQEHETLLMRQLDGYHAPVPPGGTATVVFSEVQASAALWRRNPDVMQVAIARHNRVLRTVGEEFGAYESRVQGDAFMMVFQGPVDALRWACGVQAALLREPWDEWLRRQPESELFYGGGLRLFEGPRAAMGMATGPVDRHNGPGGRAGYRGAAVELAARVAGTAKGGEVAVAFSAFAELTRLDAVRGGAVLAPYAVRDRGEVRLPPDGRAAEFVHLVAPKALVGRWDVHRRLSYAEREQGRGRQEAVEEAGDGAEEEAAGGYWVRVFAGGGGAGGGGRGRFGTPPDWTVGATLPAMARELLRRATALREMAGDAGGKASKLVVDHALQVLLLAAVMYRMLVLRNGALAPARLSAPLARRHQEDVARLLRPQYARFSEEPTEVEEMLRRRAPAAALKQKEAHSGAFDERAARQLIEEFKRIDQNRSGGIQMNEVVGQQHKFSFQNDNFDERLFKRFDKDRDGVISIMEVFRHYFPKARPAAMIRWLEQQDNLEAQAEAEQNPFEAALAGATGGGGGNAEKGEGGSPVPHQRTNYIHILIRATQA